jgi:hypothetical protein
MNRSPVLRALTALALLGIAVVHLDIAKNYTSVGTHPLALSDQFYAQAAMAVVLAIAVVGWPRSIVWAGSALFAAGSLAVLVYSRYRTIPIHGFPGGFQETWSAKGAKLAAGFELAALALAGAGSSANVGRR